MFPAARRPRAGRAPADGGGAIAAAKIAEVPDGAGGGGAGGSSPGVDDDDEDDELLVASCPGGICVVSLARGVVIARARAAAEGGGAPEAPLRISNVAFGGDGYAYVTGLGHVWRLPYDETAAVCERGNEHAE